jgi:protein subunit release factor B
MLKFLNTSNRRFTLQNNITKIWSGFFTENKNDKLVQVARADLKKMVKDKDNVLKKKIRSSGPGGQHVNKTESAVMLKDLKTNIFVKVDNSRDSVINSGIAQKRLVDKLDLHYNGSESKISKKIEKLKKQKDRSRRKSDSKYQNTPQNSK